MSAEQDAEEGRYFGTQRVYRWQHSIESVLGRLRNRLSFFRKIDEAEAERFISANGRGVGNDTGSPTEHLTLDKAACLLDTSVEDLESLHLQLTAHSGGLLPKVEWNQHNVIKLLSHCGPKAINATVPGRKSLLHESVICHALDCAKLLFAYASDKNVPVVLSWDKGGDILGWTLEKEWKATAEFILERILDKCSTPMESARIIRDHFGDLLKHLPGTMQKLIQDDRFCFEYGRFQVPAEIFKQQLPTSISKLQARDVTTTHSTEEIHWSAAASGKNVEDFWKTNCQGFAEEMDRPTAVQVTAVSKFVCINCPFLRQPRSVLSQLNSSKCSVETYKSTMVRRLVGWKWQVSAMEKQLILLCNHLLCGVLFFVFAAAFDPHHHPRHAMEGTNCKEQTLEEAPPPGDEGYNEHAYLNGVKRGLMETYVSKTALAGCSVGVWLTLLFVYQPFLFYYACNVTYIFFRCLPLKSHTDDTVFFTSFHCVLMLILVSQAVRPFKLTGPFISMVHYTIRDIIPFLLLVAVTIVTVGMALTLSFKTTRWEKNYEDFNTPQKSFQSLLYAMLGTVEQEDYQGVSNDFLSIWRAILFNSFLLLDAVVLLSLMIAILGDTFDRVMLSRDAEFVKCRAVAVEQSAFSIFYWLLSSPALRWCCGRPSQWFDADLVWIKCKSLFLWSRSSRMENKQRLGQLQKLQQFANSSTRSSDPLHSASPSSVLIFHFLEPLESDSNAMEPSSWHGRIFALMKVMEDAFSKTSESLQRHSKNTNLALARMEDRVEVVVGERIGETERTLREQSGRVQQQMERMGSRIETLLERIDCMDRTLRRLVPELDQ